MREWRRTRDAARLEDSAGGTTEWATRPRARMRSLMTRRRHVAAVQDDLAAALRRALRQYPDFPTKGVLFQDVAPVLADAALFERAVRALADPFAGRVDAVVGIESRGFVLGAPVALRLRVAFVPVRKLGKLPGRTLREDYALEYGDASLEMQEGALAPGARVLVVDDVLATGGTAAAAARLVARSGAVVSGAAFLLAIGALGGRARLPVEPLVLVEA